VLDGDFFMMSKSDIFTKWVNLGYQYVDVDDPDMQKELLDRLLYHMIRFHESWVDNDKPKTD
jgi:hypothetical protein